MSPDEQQNPSPSQSAPGNHGTVIQVARDLTGNIHIARRPKVPTTPVPTADRAAASEPLWAHTPTPQSAAEVLARYGLAVIAGEPGSGRLTSAVRALESALKPASDTYQLFLMGGDWDDDETPDAEVLPEPSEGRGYILDATSRPMDTNAALALITWAEKLHAARSYLVITANLNSWPADSRYELTAVGPDALQVARKWLAKSSPRQADWLQLDPTRSVPRGILRGPGTIDPAANEFADLIPRNVSPSNAVAIAERLRKVDPVRLTSAVTKRNDKQSTEAAEIGRREIQAIRDEVLLWTRFLEDTLAETGTRGQDRVMLLAAAYLEGAPLELCIKAAGAFGSADEPSAGRYREGRSPRNRMRAVGVDVTADDTAAFDSRPGLALAAIRMDWHHWTNERQETRRWLERITAPDGIAAKWAKQIGERLLELSRTAVNRPFFDVMEKWTEPTYTTDPDRVKLVAHLLTQAAKTDELLPDIHKKLLEWAKRKSNPHQRDVAAQVCSGGYGQRWPHRALVRLRHVLEHDDAAAETAAKALVTYASRNGDSLIRVVDTIESWFEYSNSAAGPRAFLALADPSAQPNVLEDLMPLAQAAPRIRDFFITGWGNTLQQPAVRDQAHDVLLSWARATYENRLERDFTFGILTDVRNGHQPVDAMSRFLYGSPEEEDPALINARFALANLRSCHHTECSRPACPLNQDASAPSPDTEAGL